MIGTHDQQAARAWTSFWSEQAEGSRCLAGAPDEMRRVLRDHWQSFAVNLPAVADVLDIGCGAGAVGSALVAAVPSLQVTGIDIADIPRSESARIRLLGNTPMEALPFADGSFAAAVSQFGFEYGRTDEAAAEMARVLRPGAPFSLLVHHSQSPILSDLPAHKVAVEGLCGKGLQAAFLSGDAAALQQELSALRNRSPGLFMIDGAGRGLHANISKGEAQRVRVWEAVVEALEPECFMLTALEQSSVAPDGLDHWLRPLTESFDLAPPSSLSVRTGIPIAWKFEGKRKLHC